MCAILEMFRATYSGVLPYIIFVTFFHTGKIYHYFYSHKPIIFSTKKTNSQKMYNFCVLSEFFSTSTAGMLVTNIMYCILRQLLFLFSKKVLSNFHERLHHSFCQSEIKDIFFLYHNNYVLWISIVGMWWCFAGTAFYLNWCDIC